RHSNVQAGLDLKYAAATYLNEQGPCGVLLSEAERVVGRLKSRKATARRVAEQTAQDAAAEQVWQQQQARRMEKIKKLLRRPTMVCYDQNGRRFRGIPMAEGEQDWQVLSNSRMVVLDKNGHPFETFWVKKRAKGFDPEMLSRIVVSANPPAHIVAAAEGAKPERSYVVKGKGDEEFLVVDYYPDKAAFVATRTQLEVGTYFTYRKPQLASGKKKEQFSHIDELRGALVLEVFRLEEGRIDSIGLLPVID
ncbi:MAG: hypothetical protein AAB538_05745, partial [Patescibacteria group bacterium]